MPTGYTEIIPEGATLKDYALRCARAFGALGHMRDEPLDAPLRLVPEGWDKDYDYHEKRLADSRELVSEVKNRSEAEWKTQWNESWHSSVAQVTEALEKTRKVARAYANMRAQVEDWLPPTPEHDSLKEFMLNQIDMCKSETNYKWYEDELVRLNNQTLDDFKRQTIKSAHQRLEWALRDFNEYVVRDREFKPNEWINKLQSAFPG